MPTRSFERDNTEPRLRSRLYARRSVYSKKSGVGAVIDGVHKSPTATVRPLQKKPPQAPGTRQYQGAVKRTPTVGKQKTENNMQDVVPRSLEPSVPAKKTAITNNHNRKTTVSNANKLSLSHNEHANLLKQEATNSQLDNTSKKQKKSLQYYLLNAAAIAVFVLGVGISIHTYTTNKQAKEQVAVLSSGTTNDSEDDSVELPADGVPDETEPDQSSLHNYRVAPDMPRFIRIPKIGVETRVLEMGTNEKNEVAAPANIFDAGWYTGSRKPGERGTALIDGHVSGPTTPGVFKNLKQLEAGDRIEIERGDGKIIEYEVKTKKSYPYKETDMSAALKSIEPGKNGLNLITCDGRFNAADNNYDDRLIVFAVEL